MLASWPLFAHAQTPPRRWLSTVDVEAEKKGWTLNAAFGAPLLRVGHSPAKQGSLVEISVMPLLAADRLQNAFPGEERFELGGDNLSPLTEVRLEPQTSGRALLVLKFSRPVAFDIRLSSGGRAMSVRIQETQSAPTPTSGSGTRPEQIMDEAREAMNARDYARAAALYSKIVHMDGGTDRPDALEYLGLARSKNGQRAHARADYETYLLRFPDTEGAARVRQRLDALLSSAQSDPTPLRQQTESEEYTLDAFGTLSTSYQRAESFADLSGAVLLDSSQIIEFDGIALMQYGRFDARARGSGYLRYDFLDSRIARGSRVRYLSINIRDRFLQLSGTLGRQSGGGGGILGRFDGLDSTWAYSDEYYLGAAIGFPQESATSGSIDTNRVFFQARWGLEDWNDQLAGEVWAVAQLDKGHTDRIAVGYEMRWFGSLGSAFSAMDYDLYHQALNLIMASGSLTIIEGTALNFLVDHRRVPYISIRNALISQPFTDLDAMRAIYSKEEIQQIAKDRTSTSTTITTGFDRRLGPKWQMAGDLTATTLSSTQGSYGIGATPDTGWDLYLFTQLIGNDLWLAGDTGRFGFRITDAFAYTGYEFGASGRFPFFYSLWISPRFNLIYRDQGEISDQLAMRPGLKVEYRAAGFTVEGDLRLEWLKRIGTGLPGPSDNEFGYFLDLTLRWDF
jgi:hypothetical protein